MRSLIMRRCAVCGKILKNKTHAQHRQNRFCSVACYRSITLEQRFLKKVNVAGPVPVHMPELGPCSIWIAALDTHGYGQFVIGNRLYLAHRVAWFLEQGRWPDPYALHKCDNRACVRIDHLFEGDDAANAADRNSKGRARGGNSRTFADGTPRIREHAGPMIEVHKPAP
jgi:hypothetical protein